MIDPDDWITFLEDARNTARPRQYRLSPPLDEFIVNESSKLGHSISGFTFRVDGSRIRHVMNRHGQREHENSLGQIPLTDWHLKELPKILIHPHRVEPAPKSKNIPALCLIKNYYNLGTAHAIVKVVETKQTKHLLFLTMYWHRPG